MNGGRTAAAVTKSSSLFIVLGYVFAVVSLFYRPFIFGTVGVIMGILASKYGGKAGVSVIIANIALMGIGIFYSRPLLLFLERIIGV